MTTALLEDTTRDELWSGPVIDCDVHANLPGLSALDPYLGEMWREWTRERSWAGPRGLPLHYPPSSNRTCRPQWRVEGRVPASNVELLRAHVLDPWRVDRAIVSCYHALDYMRHPDWAAALTSAVNDWLIAEWLDVEPRLAGSICVPARDPQQIADEIHRVGSHPSVVQVLLPARTDRLWGQRMWRPVWEAALEHDLVIGLHYGGTSDGAPSTTGMPSWYIEEYAAEWQAFATQLTSLVSEGAFQLYPSLRVSILECGFTWLPGWGWRMNKEWKGLRREVPWLDRPPLDIIRDHVKISVAPTDGGPRDHLAAHIEHLGSEDILMFATDYPHMYDEDIAVLLDAVPATARAKLMAETARGWYRL
jgi:predicted TIM-barrel fold metal-dependent hydrolase